MSGISRQQQIYLQKNRNLISHRPIFLINISKNAKFFLYHYLKLFVNRCKVTKENLFCKSSFDYTKMVSRVNSDKVKCGVLDDDFRLPEEESSEKESDSTLVFARKRL